MWQERCFDAVLVATLAAVVCGVAVLDPPHNLDFHKAYDAVAREIYEEVGVRVGEVRYHSSQPWPFPASLMLGFTAGATTRDICRHDGELESARWYGRAELLDSPEDASFRLPRRDSIARRLVDDWLAGNN